MFRFGNLQKYLIHHRNSFVNQIEPDSGLINFEIGRELLETNSAGKTIDFATQREVEENSAHYYVRSASEYVSTNENVPDGYLDMTSPLPASRNQFSFGHKNGSVRYTKEPYLYKSEDIPLTSDMTCNTETTNLTDDRYSRSYSVGSRVSHTGPGWRSNMKGDYKGVEIKPVSTKDLVCWAYQVFIELCVRGLSNHSALRLVEAWTILLAKRLCMETLLAETFCLPLTMS